MNSFLLDGRVLIIRYTFGTGSGLIDALFVPELRTRLVCPWLSVAELVAELNRRRRNRRLTTVIFEGAMLHVEDELIRPSTVEKLSADGAAFERTFTLLKAHVLGAVDGIVLRLALDAVASRRNAGNDLVLVTVNRGLIRAARQEGLLTFNPERQNEAQLDALVGPTSQG